MTLILIFSQINQLEKDRDVVAQAQAIATLEDFPNIPFPVINALTNFAADPKVSINLDFPLDFASINVLRTSPFSFYLVLRYSGESELKRRLHWQKLRRRYGGPFLFRQNKGVS